MFTILSSAFKFVSTLFAHLFNVNSTVNSFPSSQEHTEKKYHDHDIVFLSETINIL
ncbi:uncharacterized protein LACBIDRAFT_297817 [Laccaria bicolor S238N-H82]|uniref:Predicted protein n=1 Tax=Laccaria bicolor (strain S238N-H82 / ATCC MYA-4686) TaxID=486041 RepID=B0D9U2_LACBS|nr:uncharacterized protein LACBIDRAFT_297030 [Laccaria bicolor S238N-H82]XP_001881186.1 uncharacterized protein LACBIDRAFT_297817 [Laccaria bicolor S238N-H82]EDR08116.1 predicted protein [Laccaria bicolor S238N-H82]EDR08643.1 predicted protein [Laccaria bicolor S238N-H82]|eukprot:XP_001880868.1 predicted protein [Laccaria bicolor S238N-H82]